MGIPPLVRRLVLLLTLASLAAPAAAAAADPTLSTTDRLTDRRFVTLGPRAYEVGTEDGRYPAMGFHTRGEMGGVWAPPLKLLDGLWFGLDGHWIGPATRFTSGQGYVRMDLPTTAGLRLSRTDFVPDGRRAVLVGLTATSTGAAAGVDLALDAHSELMSAYPWGETLPSQLTANQQDTARIDGGRLLFEEHAAGHDWAAAVGSTATPVSGRTGTAFRGPQDPPTICPPSGPNTPGAPPRCDDTAYGKGAGGELHYRLSVPAGGSRTLWFAVAGSNRGPAGAAAQAGAVLRDPAGLLAAKRAARRRIAASTRVSLPGDPLLAQGVEWSKQNLADAVQTVDGMDVRVTNQGKDYPPPIGHLGRETFLGAGFPDYPWLFSTDGEYSAFAAVAAGQFAPIEAHLRALRDVSELVNGDTGKVVHEVVSTGDVYFGTNADPGNTDETVKFPSAVALVWRWTGDNAFRDDLYSFAVRGMRYVMSHLDADGDGWPEGSGNVERPGMGAEKLDVSVYAIRGLRDLAVLARSKGDVATAAWADGKAADLQRRFTATWWMPSVPAFADSLADPGDHQLQQRYWIGVTPMEAELPGRTSIATPAEANAALDLREKPCYGDSFGLYHTGAPGCDPAVSSAPADRESFSLNTAIMAVGEGNYGRLGPAQQQRFTTANRRLMLPAPDEQPGSMPEIAPSPDYGRSIDRPLNERAQVEQTWGTYGILWPVVHQQLGVAPDAGRGALAVVPQVPAGQSRVAGRAIRVGTGSVDVAARASAHRYRTTVTEHGAGLRLTLGAVLPAGAHVRRVTLNGHPVPYRARPTQRGLEVTAAGGARGRQTLVVRV